MVVVHFRLTEAGRVEIEIARPERLEDILLKCAAKAKIQLGGIIAIRNGSVIQRSDLVESGDEIDIFPAISGG